MINVLLLNTSLILSTFSKIRLILVILSPVLYVSPTHTSSAPLLCARS